MVVRRRVRMTETVVRKEGNLLAGKVHEVTEPHATALVDAGKAVFYEPTGKGALGQWARPEASERTAGAPPKAKGAKQPKKEDAAAETPGTVADSSGE